MILISVSRLRRLDKQFPQRSNVITDAGILRSFEVGYVKNRMDEMDMRKELNDKLMRMRVKLRAYQVLSTSPSEAEKMDLKKPTKPERLLAEFPDCVRAINRLFDSFGDTINGAGAELQARD